MKYKTITKTFTFRRRTGFLSGLMQRASKLANTKNSRKVGRLRRGQMQLVGFKWLIDRGVVTFSVDFRVCNSNSTRLIFDVYQANPSRWERRVEEMVAFADHAKLLKLLATEERKYRATAS